jgi:hypothetical protein
MLIAVAKLTLKSDLKKIPLAFQAVLSGAGALVLLGVLVASFFPPSLVLEKEFLFFGAVENGPSTPSQNISLVIKNGFFGAHRNITWQAEALTEWLAVEPAKGKGTGDLRIGIDPRKLRARAYRGKVAVSCSGAANSPREIKVTLDVFANGTSSPPFGFVDFPPDGQIVSGDVIEVWGWALDDIGVSEVDVERSLVRIDDPKAANPDGFIPVGKARFLAGGRPDVENAFPRFPFSSRAGWWIRFPVKSVPVEEGESFRIRAVAVDEEGQSAVLNNIKTLKLAR